MNTPDPVQAARQRLRDAITATGLPAHHAVSVYAAADALAKEREIALRAEWARALRTPLPALEAATGERLG